MPISLNKNNLLYRYWKIKALVQIAQVHFPKRITYWRKSILKNVFYQFPRKFTIFSRIFFVNSNDVVYTTCQYTALSVLNLVTIRGRQYEDGCEDGCCIRCLDDTESDISLVALAGLLQPTGAVPVHTRWTSHRHPTLIMSLVSLRLKMGSLFNFCWLWDNFISNTFQ